MARQHPAHFNRLRAERKLKTDEKQAIIDRKKQKASDLLLRQGALVRKNRDKVRKDSLKANLKLLRKKFTTKVDGEHPTLKAYYESDTPNLDAASALFPDL